MKTQKILALGQVAKRLHKDLLTVKLWESVLACRFPDKIVVPIPGDPWARYGIGERFLSYFPGVPSDCSVEAILQAFPLEKGKNQKKPKKK